MNTAKVLGWTASVAIVVLFAATLTPCEAEEEARASFYFDEGWEHLQQGRLDQALDALGQAAKLDPSNQAYVTEAALLRRVMKLREDLAKETDEGRWMARARALRAYYYDKGLPAEALALDRQVHEKSGDPTSALLLAESMLENGRNAEAVTLLEALPAKERATAGNLMMALAQLRQGEDPGKDLQAAVTQVSADAPAAQKFLLARLQARMGRDGQALAALRSAFESTPGSMHESLRRHVTRCGDFADLASQGDFERVLTTESKIPESSCSSDSSCGSCPSRTSCSSGK